MNEDNDLLMKLEEYIKSVWEFLPIPVAYVNYIGIIMDSNPLFLDFFNLKQEDVVGSSLIKLIPNFTLLQKETLQKKGLNNRELHIVVNNKNLILNVSTKVSTDDNGKTVGYFISFTDVTKQKEIQDALMESKNKYQDLIENTNDIVYALNEKGKITYVSPKLKLIGLNPESILNKNFVNAGIIIPEDIPKVLTEFNKSIKMGNEVQTNFRIKNNKGKIRWLENKSTVQKDLKGNVTGINGTLRDVTEQKEIQDVLIKSEAKYKYLYDNSLNFLITIDLSGKIIDMNPAALKRMQEIGYSSKELIGLNFRKLIPAKYVPQILKGLMLDVIGKTSPPIEVQIVGKNKMYMYVSFVSGSTPIFNDKRKVVALQVTGNDTTERKVFEEKLIDSENKFKLLFDFSPDAYYTNDIKGNFIDGNKAAETLLGYKKEELIGKSFLKARILPTYEIPKALKLLALSLRGKPTGPDKFKLITKKGEEKIVELRTQPAIINKQRVVLGSARDITEQERLLGAQEKLALIVESTDDAIISKDLTGIIRSWNNGATKLYGYTPEEIIGKSVNILVPKDKPTEVEEILDNIKSNKTITHLETVRLTKSKERVDVSLTISPLKDEYNHVIGASVIARDITNEKKAALEITNLKNEYERIFQSSKDVILNLNLKGIVTKVNNAFTTITGYSVNEMLGKSVLGLKFLDNASLFNIAKRIPLILLGKEMPNLNINVTTKTGGIVIGELSSSRLLDNNKVIGIQTTIRDVTDQVKNKLLLIESEVKYRTLIESYDDCIKLIDLNGKMLFMNKAGLNEHKLATVDEASKWDWTSSVINKDEAMIAFNKAVNGEQSSCEVMHTKEGSNRDVCLEVFIPLKDDKGKTVSVLAIGRDMTEIKKAEAILLKQKTQEEMTNLKNQFLMRLSHELRHPLVPVVGYASVMLEQNPTSTQKGYIEKILQNANQLKSLIDEVLEVISFESGSAAIKPASFKIKSLLTKIISDFKLEAKNKGLEIIKNFEVDPTVILDEDRIQNALSKIIDNAIKYTTKGHVKISLSVKKDHAIITVEDTGKGMSNDELNDLFKYKIEEEDYSEMYKGLGLGLMLTKYIVDAHKGTMNIFSNLGKGTKVIITLPLKVKK